MKRGKVHDYPGMDLDYYTKEEVKIGMIKYLQKVEDEFPEPILGIEKSPAGEHLFQVREEMDPQKRYLKNQGGTIPPCGCSAVVCIQKCTPCFHSEQYCFHLDR